jgi:SanA protein
MDRRRALRLAARTGVLALAVVIVAIVAANCGIARRADGRIYTDAGKVPHRTWVIVPGALVHSDGTPSVALVDRLDAARALYQAGTVDRIFVSGDTRDHDEDGVMARWLVDHDVPADRIVRDGTGYRTRTTMENARRLGIVDAVISTQAFHVPRSIAWARHVGIDALGLEADLRWYDHQVSARTRETLARTVAMLEIVIDR